MVYTIWRVLVWPWYRLWLRKVDGIENVPNDIPFIIAANHSSYYDALLLHGIIALKIEKKIHAFVNSWYWKIPVIKIVLNSGECIPVYVGKEKNAKHKNKQALEKAIGYFKKGEIVMIFPEGTRSDGKLKKAYTGIARLALESKAPVLPVGIIDSNKVLPKGKFFPRFVRCEVKFGKLMYFERYYNKKPNDRILEEVTRSIMEKI